MRSKAIFDQEPPELKEFLRNQGIVEEPMMLSKEEAMVTDERTTLAPTPVPEQSTVMKSTESLPSYVTPSVPFTPLKNSRVRSVTVDKTPSVKSDFGQFRPRSKTNEAIIKSDNVSQGPSIAPGKVAAARSAFLRSAESQKAPPPVPKKLILPSHNLNAPTLNEDVPVTPDPKYALMESAPIVAELETSMDKSAASSIRKTFLSKESTPSPTVSRTSNLLERLQSQLGLIESKDKKPEVTPLERPMPTPPISPPKVHVQKFDTTESLKESKSKISFEKLLANENQITLPAAPSSELIKPLTKAPLKPEIQNKEFSEGSNQTSNQLNSFVEPPPSTMFQRSSALLSTTNVDLSSPPSTPSHRNDIAPVSPSQLPVTASISSTSVNPPPTPPPAPSSSSDTAAIPPPPPPPPSQRIPIPASSSPSVKQEKKTILPTGLDSRTDLMAAIRSTSKASLRIISMTEIRDSSKPDFLRNETELSAARGPSVGGRPRAPMDMAGELKLALSRNRLSMARDDDEDESEWE